MNFQMIFSAIYHKTVVGKGFLFIKADSSLSESMTGVPIYKKADNLEALHSVLHSEDGMSAGPVQSRLGLQLHCLVLC